MNIGSKPITLGYVNVYLRGGNLVMGNCTFKDKATAEKIAGKGIDKNYYTTVPVELTFSQSAC